MNKLIGMTWSKNIPFWTLFIFVLIGAICEIIYRRFDLLMSLLPILILMFIYLLFRRQIPPNKQRH